MPAERIQKHRRERLHAAADKVGGKAALGRLLGYKDGAFVGQMLRGERPITEDTVHKLEAKHGFKGWFSGAQGDAAPPPPPPGFADRRWVSDSDWALLQDIRLLPDDELDALRTRVAKLRERVDLIVSEKLKAAGVRYRGQPSGPPDGKERRQVQQPMRPGDMKRSSDYERPWVPAESTEDAG